MIKSITDVMSMMTSGTKLVLVNGKGMLVLEVMNIATVRRDVALTTTLVKLNVLTTIPMMIGKMTGTMLGTNMSLELALQ